VFGVIIGVTVDLQAMSYEGKHAYLATQFPYTAAAFLVGAGTSILSGYIGMRIAVYTNTRTTFQCCKSVNDGFLTAFRGGQVLGFVLVGLALLILESLIAIFKVAWFDGAIAAMLANPDAAGNDFQADLNASLLTRAFFELIAGYGLGGSTVALFGRVGGGIYTKAADVGADLVGKNLKDLKEDDPSNPGTIADNVGDNVGDIAGMGADLFGSLAESTCAALVVSSTSYELIKSPDALYFPLMVTASGIVASFLSVLCIHFWTVTIENVQTVLKAQIGISTVFMTITVIPSLFVLPETFIFQRPSINGVSMNMEVGRW
jgi:inorganic pyrophosphatase